MTRFPWPNRNGSLCQPNREMKSRRLQPVKTLQLRGRPAGVKFKLLPSAAPASHCAGPGEALRQRAARDPLECINGLLTVGEVVQRLPGVARRVSAAQRTRPRRRDRLTVGQPEARPAWGPLALAAVTVTGAGPGPGPSLPPRRAPACFNLADPPAGSPVVTVQAAGRCYRGGSIVRTGSLSLGRLRFRLVAPRPRRLGVRLSLTIPWAAAGPGVPATFTKLRRQCHWQCRPGAAHLG